MSDAAERRLAEIETLPALIVAVDVWDDPDIWSLRTDAMQGPFVSSWTAIEHRPASCGT